jgi:D-alanyl-D-alanine carboxypeptidase (penicillin-binding protein 5/6)
MRFHSAIAALLVAGLSTSALAQSAMPSFATPAPYAFMLDMSNGAVLYQKEPDAPMPPASMGKMMTVYVAFAMIKRGEITLDKKITVRPETWTKWHSQGSTMFLSPGEQVSVEDLLHGIVTLSGNDACVVLGEGLAGTDENFVALMNKTAQQLGMKGSRFANTNGWPDPGEMVTARDLATVAQATIRDFPDLYKKFYGQPSFTWGKTLGAGAAITQTNRNPILGRVAGADGLKTGHTEDAGYGFTGSAVQDGRRLVMVLAGLSSFNERISASVAFMEWGFNAFGRKLLVRPGQIVGTAKVWMGEEADVGLTSATDLKVTVPRGSANAVKAKIVYQGPVQAPIVKGTKIAELVVSVPGFPDTRLPLIAANAVEKAGPFGRIAAAFRALVLD